MLGFRKYSLCEGIPKYSVGVGGGGILIDESVQYKHFRTCLKSPAQCNQMLRKYYVFYKLLFIFCMDIFPRWEPSLSETCCVGPDPRRPI